MFKDMGYGSISNGGELKGLFNARDIIIPQYLNKLEQMAGRLIVEVNAIHKNGYSLGADENAIHNFSTFHREITA